MAIYYNSNEKLIPQVLSEDSLGTLKTAKLGRKFNEQGNGYVESFGFLSKKPFSL